MIKLVGVIPTNLNTMNGDVVKMLDILYKELEMLEFIVANNKFETIERYDNRTSIIRRNISTVLQQIEQVQK